MYQTQLAAVRHSYQNDHGDEDIAKELECDECGHVGLVYLGPKVAQGRVGYVKEADRAKCPKCRAIIEF